jgi:arabinogalactan oligomer/maltooligosaccharide transport system substrate-binding protein
VSGPWAITDVKKAGIKYDITGVPAFAGGKPAQPFLGVQTFYVAAKGKNKALAQEFVTNYVTTPDLAVALYQAEPRPPALTAAFDQVKSSDPDLAKWQEAGKNAIPLPAIPEMAAIWDPFGKAEAAVVGGADPAKTIEAAGKTISGSINK